MSLRFRYCFGLYPAQPNYLYPVLEPVWPDSAIYWTLGNLLKPLAPINLPKSPTFLVIFCKGFKIYQFLVKSFLGKIYRYLAILFWSHWILRLVITAMDSHSHVSLANLQRSMKESLLVATNCSDWGRRQFVVTNKGSFILRCKFAAACDRQLTFC